MALSLDNALAAGEGQMVEFKESLKLAKEGMQATVAFANARGGDVFFGVRDRDHVAIGVEVGANTLAQLANDFERRIYPSLPVEIDEFPLGNGKAVVRVSVPQDVPPLIGAYLFSDSNIDSSKEVDAAPLQAFRRVGRTSQKIDFMLLRQPRTTDPMMLVTASGFSGESFSATAFLPEGSGIAHQVQVRLDPPLAAPTSIYETLPRSDRQRSFSPSFALTAGQASEGVWLIVRCKDDWGCTWDFGKWVELPRGRRDATREVPDAYRRIVRFPPKRRFAGPEPPAGLPLRPRPAV